MLFCHPNDANHIVRYFFTNNGLTAPAANHGCSIEGWMARSTGYWLCLGCFTLRHNLMSYIKHEVLTISTYSTHNFISYLCYNCNVQILLLHCRLESESPESGALSLSSAARHIDFHLLRRIYVALVAHSKALSLHIYL